MRIHHSFAVLLCVAVITWLASGAPQTALAEDLSISNEYVEVHCESDRGRISCIAKASGVEFLRDATLSGDGGEAKVIHATDDSSVAEPAIEISYPDGNSDRVSILRGTPFVTIRARKANSGAQPVVHRSVPTVSSTVDLGTSAKATKTFGTGGLLPPDKNPGSYVWTAVVDPESRRGVVFGWLSHDRGSGVLFTERDGDAVRVNARLDYGRLTIPAGGSAELETLAIGYFDDARLGLEAWADAVAARYHIDLPPQPVGYCTWYSRPYGGASDEQHLAELADFSARALTPYGFSVVQIDDKWQAGESTNGPNRQFSSHNPKGPYPRGMKAAAQQVASLGLTPGLWYMPFAGTYYDPFFKDHQDWFVKRENGEPYETAWGGTCLDLTHPDVQRYVRSIADRIVNEWGFRYLKLDGLWTGTATKQQYVNSGFKEDGIGDAVFRDPKVTNIEAYRSGLKLVRDAVGRKTFILGCNGPQNMRSYGGAFGLVDAMRVGPDNGSEWNRLLRGPEFGSRHYFLHRRIWYNDPDPVYVRAEMPLNHAQLICSWVAVSGQLNLSSEWLPGLPPDRLAILQHTMPSHGLKPRPVDLFEQDPPRLWLLTDDRAGVRRDVIGVFNWENKDLEIDESLERLGLKGGTSYEAFDYWQNLHLPRLDRLQMTVPKESCRILAVRPVADHPQLISTSRHVTQGIVDVANETWDASSRTLSGTSHVVGGDRYELRVSLPPNGGAWTAETFEASAGEAHISQEKHEEALVRAAIDSPISQDIQWRLHFSN